MPELKWDPFDFFYCLEVEPEIEEYGVSYSYEVAKNGLNLTVFVLPYESRIEVSLRQENCERALFSFATHVHGEVRHINDKRGEYLEFTNCLISPLTYSDMSDSFNNINHSWTIELSIKPQIQIRYLD